MKKASICLIALSEYQTVLLDSICSLAEKYKESRSFDTMEALFGTVDLYRSASEAIVEVQTLKEGDDNG